MAASMPRITPLVSRWQGLRISPRTKSSGFVCGQCQRQKQRRKFHSSTVFRKRNSEDHAPVGRKSLRDAEDADNLEKKDYRFNVDELESEERADYESLSPKDQEVFRNDRKRIHDILNSREAVAEFRSMTAQSIAQAERHAPHIEKPPRGRLKYGFWNMGESNKEEAGEDEVYAGDDLSELGHAELEQHREMREYARIAAWEMPLLSKLATPFQPPDMEHVLRFRYTTYMGEDHPAAKKIVLEFCPSDLPGLTPAQRTKLIKLVGVRYNPETDVVKMSSEMFETQAQNKRYLGDLVDTLMSEARDASDMFEDVPLDFRHHRFKKKVEFPEEWKLTPARRAQLEQERTARLELEQRRVSEGKVVDGGEILRLAMEAMPSRDESKVLVEQQRGGKKTGGKRMLR